MAEAFSIVGVASLAIQLLKETDKLATFLRPVKGAPCEIRDLSTELDILADTLQELRKISPAPVQDPAKAGSAVKALKFCSDVLHMLQLVLDDAFDTHEDQLILGLQTWSIRSFGMGRRIKQLSKIMPRLERAISLLQLANQDLLK